MANKLFFNSFILSLFFLTSQANTLAKIEVDALVQIGKKMGKSNWDFKVDPCSGLGNWSIPNPVKGFESFVNCSCSLAVNNSTCHITSLSLKGENLSGTLPPEIAKLKYLQQLDLSRNYLNGTVPKEWSTLKLLGLSLMANRLSGKFPDTLTQITTLVNLSIEGNRFSGPLPSSIGKLVNLESLTISANQFTGNLPLSMKMLTHLTDLRLSSNNFSGKIPDFIQSLTKLNKLHIQGCSFKGPIPSAISHLKNLTDLRITDLIGNTSTMPDLSGMKNMKTLMLRNCSIHGNIPSYIGNTKTLKYLDLSFNEMGGDIPETFSSLMKVDKIYLTDNMLTGTISSLFLRRTKDTDISYNNFIMDKSSPNQCSHGTINMAECYSTSPDITTVPSCLKKNFPCTETGDYRSSLHINCGGESISLNGTKYEQDNEQVLAASLYSSTSGWAFSSTGNFMDDDLEADNYIASNSSALSMPNSQLYTRARLSPITLTYYARCMMNGSYTVNLHFAEIVFTNDRTFLSLGERVFNVYIQEKLVLEDFNIAKEAGGPGKAIIKTFNVSISNHVMKIRFYWAGKGTTGIPNRGTYGPLINAISITPNFEVPTPETHSRKKTVILLWTLILSSILILLGFGFLWWKRSRRIGYVYKDLDGFDLKTGSFTLRQVKAATRNFDATNKIGEGGFGSVYKGLLKDGTIIAVKQLSSKSKQGSREFVNEIGMISSLHHPNLVKLYGCCTEGNQLLLIYEYMENNCLARALFGKNPEFKLNLDWPTRRNICIGIARGLAYLHEESRLKIVHRDIKASNVLLDKELNAKISDFGLAKLNEDDHTHISTRIAGTIGYMAPEYAMRGHLTVKADIYSFGVVALEIVSGKSNTNYRPKEDFVYLLDWACVLQEKGNLLELVDPELGSDYSEEEALLMLNIALLCTHASPTLRPAMSKVISIIEGSTPLQPLLNHMNLSANSLSSAGIRRNFWENPGQSLSLSHDVSFTDSSDYTSNRGNDSILEKDISDSVSLMQ